VSCPNLEPPAAGGPAPPSLLSLLMTPRSPWLDRHGAGGQRLGLRSAPSELLPTTRPIRIVTTDRLGMELDPGELDRFYPLLRHGGDAALDTFLEHLLRRGISESRVLLELLHPAAGRLGEDWDMDRCSFLEVAVGAGRLQRLVRSLTRRDHLRTAPPRAERPRVLLASSSQQQHTLGLLMVAEFFRKAHWRVDIGAPLRPERASDRVRDQHFHVVGLSIPLLESVAMVRREVQRIRHRSRNPEIGILVGGIAVATHPELVDDVGADAAAPDAHLAPDVAEAFI